MLLYDIRTQRRGPYYQIPSPMRIMPMASQPSTPIEMIVSSVMLDSEEWNVC